MSHHEENPPGVDAGALSAVHNRFWSNQTNYKFSGIPSGQVSFKPDDWPQWIQRFERFCKEAGLDEQRGKNQVNTLISAMGDQEDDILVSFELIPEQEKDYEQVKEKFQNYFIVKRNYVWARKIQFKETTSGRTGG